MRIAIVSLLCALCSCAMARSGALMEAHERFAEGSYQEAITLSEEALSYGSPKPKEVADAYLLKAKSLEALGEWEEAAALYVFIIETYPGTPHDFQARARLQKIDAERPMGTTL